MPDEYYCKLYIDTQENIEEINSAIDKIKLKVNLGFNLEVVLYKNENFEPGARTENPYRVIECSQFYAEVGLNEEEFQQISAFQAGVAELVKTLRDGERFVTVSCDFEDSIVTNTGWNWTPDTPEPPGRSSSRTAITRCATAYRDD